MSKDTKEMEFMDAISELNIKLEKARCVMNNITQGFFSKPEEWHEADKGRTLVYNYEATSTMADIVDDYLFESSKIITQLQEGTYGQ